METPKPEYEKKILRDVLEQVKNPDDTMGPQIKIRKVIFGMSYTALIISFFLAQNELSHPFTSAFLAAIAGLGIGIGVLLKFIHKQWPITKRHIDLESVEKRLNELETNEPQG